METLQSEEYADQFSNAVSQVELRFERRRGYFLLYTVSARPLFSSLYSPFDPSTTPINERVLRTQELLC